MIFLLHRSFLLLYLHKGMEVYDVYRMMVFLSVENHLLMQ